VLSDRRLVVAEQVVQGRVAVLVGDPPRRLLHVDAVGLGDPQRVVQELVEVAVGVVQRERDLVVAVLDREDLVGLGGQLRQRCGVGAALVGRRDDALHADHPPVVAGDLHGERADPPEDGVHGVQDLLAELRVARVVADGARELVGLPRRGVLQPERRRSAAELLAQVRDRGVALLGADRVDAEQDGDPVLARHQDNGGLEGGERVARRVGSDRQAGGFGHGMTSAFCV
jgi:hypothetical protein